MPAHKKAPARSNLKVKQKPSWFSRMMTTRYAQPIGFVIGFMFIGAGSALWAMAATNTTSIWTTNPIPKVLASTDSSSTELGLRFKSNVAGYVTGVRFYKSAQNSGTHVGSLWDNSGKLLASVTFTGETASGWQSANFDKAVSIASNTSYVISYHAPRGHYSYDSGYFSRSAFQNSHLRAVRNTTAHTNGLYTKSTSTTAFPQTGGNGTNYWVDVLFSTKLINSQPAPAAPASVTATAQSSTRVSVSWQASVSSTPVSQYTVYRNGTMLANVAGTVTTYSDVTAAASTTYTYQVQATDSTGAHSALSQNASVTTPASSSDTGGTDTGTGTTTGSTGSTCPLPKFPDASCTGVPAGTSLTVVSGDMDITAANTVISGKDIRGCITVSAPGVVIKNSKVTCTSGGDAILSEDGTYGGNPLVIQDSEISCGNKTGMTAIGDTNFTTYRLNIHGCENGYDIDAYADIEDNYIHDLANSADSHTDGIQFAVGHYASVGSKTVINGALNVTINHNTILSKGVDGTDTTSAIISNRGGDTNVLIQNNLLAGGAYTLYCEQNATGINYRVIGNHFSTLYHPTVGAYGPSDSCSDETMSGNVYQETGAPIHLD
jgi:hypothetical protein